MPENFKRDVIDDGVRQMNFWLMVKFIVSMQRSLLDYFIFNF